MPTGGYWDKKGNQFEYGWALRQLVSMLSPFSEIESLELESVGEDELGVDLWVNRKNGIRECHQCKSANGNRSGWSIADLGREGIFDSLRFQIGRAPSLHRYCFVSGTPAPHYERLCNEARDSRDAETFWRDQIQPVKALYRAALDACASTGLLVTDPSDREAFWLLFRSSSFKMFRDDVEHRNDLMDRLEGRIDGDPRLHLEVLEIFLRGHPRLRIDVQAVANFLSSRGCRLIRGATDAFRRAVGSLAQKRGNEGSLLRLQEELSLAQDSVTDQLKDLRQVQVLAARWRLVRRIGTGGFAEVWEGHEQDVPESARERVAVKVLLPGKAKNPALLARFYQGGRLAMSILDPRIQRVRNGPREAEGRHFYVMEYVDGEDLASWMAKKMLPLRAEEEIVALWKSPLYLHAAWCIFLSVAGALTSLHNAGLVHGDVKPGNVIASRQGAVKLCDFDLVHLVDSADSVVLGTLPYLAPEVLGGKQPTPLSDQYSLAMTLVAMLAGADLASTVMYKNLAALLRDLPCSQAVKRNLARALEPDAQKRFLTVEAFRENIGPEALGHFAAMDV